MANTAPTWKTRTGAAHVLRTLYGMTQIPKGGTSAAPRPTSGQLWPRK